MSIDRAIILAAGKGRRLEGHIREGIPKSLMEINGRTILERQVLSLLGHDVKKIVIVIGYGDKEVVDYCESLEKKYPVKFDFVYNPDYATTNTVYSLYLARHFLSRDTLFMNGDVLFHPHIISLLIASPAYHALAVEKKECGEEEVKVLIDDNMRITRIAKTIKPNESFGEFIGVARFGGEDEAFVASLEHVCQIENNKNTFFEYAIDKILDYKRFYAVLTHGLPTIEIDFYEDMQKAEKEIAPLVDEALKDILS